MSKEAIALGKCLDNFSELYYKEVNRDELYHKIMRDVLKEYNFKNNDDFFTYDYRRCASINTSNVSIIIEMENGEWFVRKISYQKEKCFYDIEKDDKIISINKKVCKNITVSNLCSLLLKLYKRKIDIMIEIQRGKLTKNILIESEKKKVRNVISKEFSINDNKKVGYIKLLEFSKNSNKVFKNKLEVLERNNINSLIIDLRDNPGGISIELEKIISLFLDKSNIIYKYNRQGKIKYVWSSGSITKKYPIVILINGISASSSEIMISALMDKYGAISIGTKTFGKGISVNTSWNPDYYVSFVTAEWYTTKNVWVHKKGIEPTIKVEYELYDNGMDSQLKAALDYLKDK